MVPRKLSHPSLTRLRFATAAVALLPLLISTSCQKSRQAAESPEPPTTAEAVKMEIGAGKISPLTIKDGHFVDVQGNRKRFWGVNLCAPYLSEQQVTGLVDDLVYHQINLVRPHHLARGSRDWTPETPSGSILKLDGNSRDFEPEAVGRFDYLNAELRKKGIYLAMSAHQTRQVLAGDVDILETSAEDKEAWKAAVSEMHSWGWQKAFDLWKILPTLDERAALLAKEFTEKQLNHVNPHTGLSYAEDPQVLTIEVVNESSFEYAIICNNRFPDYFQNKLEARWKAYAEEAGLEAGDFYKVNDQPRKTLRAKFLRKLDEDYYLKMREVIRSTGSKAPITFSNLWRGDNPLDMNEKNSDWIENHTYTNPLMASSLSDGIQSLSRTALTGKPFFVGELNHGEGDENKTKQAPFRSMLPVAMAAYGSLQNWDGLVWFAWTHGTSNLDENGHGRAIDRDSHLGAMTNDAMLKDHMRSLGIVFRNQLISPAREEIVVKIDRNFTVGDYDGLLRGKNNYQPGWQGVHAMRKSYGEVPDGQDRLPWMVASPANPVVSDTGEIVKDIGRRQITVSAPQVEILSGEIDGETPAGLKHLLLDWKDRFVTAVLVSLDGKPISSSRHLLISRTISDPDRKETTAPAITLRDLQPVNCTEQWQLKITRASSDAPGEIIQDSENAITLPTTGWFECELTLPGSK